MAPSVRPLRRCCTVTLLSTVVAVGSRATPAPTAREVHERWRKRLPAQIERLRPALRERAAAALGEAQMERLRAASPAERRTEIARLRRAARQQAPSPAPRGSSPSGPVALTTGFHAGGAAVCEPQPINPLLDPLAIFEDETGEEPPVEAFSRYFFADFDGDGDLDVFVGDKYGYVRYLENVGSAGEPIYQELTGAASPTGALDLSPAEDDATDEPFGPSAPTLIDIDGDLDLDLFVGTGYDEGRVLFFRNDGSGNLVRDDAGNPLGGFVFGTGYATPHFVDVDGDLDFDAFVGTKGEQIPDDGIEGEVFFLRNDGTPTAPSFSDQTDVAGVDPLAGVAFAPFTAPFFADLDGDADLDAFVGDLDLIHFFRNTAGVFSEESGYTNPLAGSSLFAPAPAFADVDDDGDLDAFLGGGFFKGNVAYFFENTGDATDPGFLSTAAHVELTDVDGDGDLDALASLKLADPAELVEPVAGVALFRNQGTATTPRWELESGPDNPFSAFNAGFTSIEAAPTVGDLDGDGLLEAFVGNAGDGYLEYLEFDPISGQFVPGTHPLETIFLGNDTDPQLVDLDGDGELDLLVGYSENGTDAAKVAVFLNPPGAPGLGTVPDFVVDLASTGGSEPRPTAADVDGDGDPDLLVGILADAGPFSDYSTYLVVNTGDAMNPTFDGSTAQLLEVAQGGVASPAAADLNGDGLLDLVIGSYAGAEVFLTEALGVTVSPASGLTTTEAGGTDGFTVVLDAMPAGTVIFDLAVSDATEGSVSPAQLSFDGSNWSQPQLVTLTGVDDPDADGPQPYQVQLSLDAASTAGPCIAQPSVSAVNLDDEAALLTATKEVTGGDLEAGGSVVYTLTITNIGAATQPDDPASPELTDTLPSDLTLISATVSSGPGTATTSGNTVRWDGSLTAGGSATIRVTAAIGAVAEGTEIANQAQVFSDNDGDASNESALPSDDPATPEANDPTVFAVGAAVSVLEIPTVSSWGAALLAALLSLLGLAGLRRRRPEPEL